MSNRLFAPAPPPPTALGRYRILAPRAGVRVSPIQLGAGSIGDRWNDVGGNDMTKEMSFKLLDAYFDAGGNIIDTGNNYQDEASEEFIGEWMEQRGNRDRLVIATKYTFDYKIHTNLRPQVNYAGNNAKTMRMSIDASLKKLRTEYVDIFYVHFWDWSSSMEEVMDGLHNLVVAGKVLYLGASNTPAWIVSQANQYAKMSGKTPFVIYQGSWNVMDRSFERDIIPMARSLGLALAPFQVLNAGRFRTDAEEEKRRQTGEKGRTFNRPNWERTEDEKKMAAALEKVAKEVGTEHSSAVAVAYVMQKAPYVFPIIGGRKVEHLMANIEALKISLTEKQIEYLESIFPHDFGPFAAMSGDITTGSPVQRGVGSEDRVPPLQAIRPARN